MTPQEMERIKQYLIKWMKHDPKSAAAEMEAFHAWLDKRGLLSILSNKDQEPMFMFYLEFKKDYYK